MDLPNRIILACGNTAILNDRENRYYCNYCNYMIGSSDEPEACKRKRDDVQPFKNDYWMDINDDTRNSN